MEEQKKKKKKKKTVKNMVISIISHITPYSFDYNLFTVNKVCLIIKQLNDQFFICGS